MKKSILLTLTIGCAATLVAEELNGRKIMEAQKEKQKVSTEYGEEIMLLKDLKAGTQEQRTARRHSTENEAGMSRSLFVFLSPANIAGTAILTWEQEKDDDQWLYMPATKKMQRIASGSKKNYFMGTDFTYEDMEPEDIGNFNYTVLRTETIPLDGKEWLCWVIDAEPANEQKTRESAYSKRTLWVAQDAFITLKAEFYDKRGRLVKTQTIYELENVAGTVWRPKKTMMDNVSKSSQTLTMVSNRKINEPIADDVFTERFILSGRHTE